MAVARLRCPITRIALSSATRVQRPNLLTPLQYLVALKAGLMYWVVQNRRGGFAFDSKRKEIRDPLAVFRLLHVPCVPNDKLKVSPSGSEPVGWVK
ncbi:hypothetical protein TNIN_165721 [Trichonephila inaurata madagascariensis]|uniref:Uncharacterized protein n=1 Tax=Trichonephila inaurata madagascariensis TaxID=2747483 RepID=A0A8X6WXR3_9ARAC|nr:hypothetical protein TNIN_165721 [Trichonephila inaurata madagascariensis]